MGGTKPTARQNVLLEHDTDSGGADTGGLLVVATGRLVWAHVDPFHTWAGTVPVG
jgi:hypothetical protein